MGVEGRYDTTGFYVDVGAHHPYRYSNTYYFYERGWRGINIDPAKGMALTFNAARPRDTNLEVAVARTSKPITFIEFNDPALSGCDEGLAHSREGMQGRKIIGRRSVEAKPLSLILQEHTAGKQQVDFLSIDVEGLDLEVLESNDWNTWRPKLVVVEDISVVVTPEITTSPIGSFLTRLDYSPVSKLGVSMIFADSSRMQRTALGIQVR